MLNVTNMKVIWWYFRRIWQLRHLRRLESKYRTDFLVAKRKLGLDRPYDSSEFDRLFIKYPTISYRDALVRAIMMGVDKHNDLLDNPKPEIRWRDIGAIIDRFNVWGIQLSISTLCKTSSSKSAKSSDIPCFDKDLIDDRILI